MLEADAFQAPKLFSPSVLRIGPAAAFFVRKLLMVLEVK
jgi:hypothetical protein